MKEKTKKNWQTFILFIFAILIAGLFVICFYLYNQIEQSNKTLAKLEIQNIAKQKDLAMVEAWQKNIIEQYVDTANLVLNNDQDTKTAILLLDSAKKYTNNLANKDIIIHLDKNINLLKAVNLVNTEELIARIDVIGQAINNLSMLPNTVPTPVKIKTPDNAKVPVKYSQLSKQLFDRVLKSLKDIVIIRHHALEPILLENQEAILRFNVNAKIMLMQLAIMQKHDAIYHSCLVQIAKLIKQYFVCSSDEKNNILKQLSELEKINLQPQMPKITL